MNGYSPSVECARCRELERQLATQQQQLAAQGEQLATQGEQLATLQSRVKELQKQLDQQTRASKRQAAPFRRTKKKPESEKKKPGRKVGHARDARPEPAKVDRTIPVPVDVCPDCRVPLAGKTVHVQYQTDIPPVQPIVTAFHVEVGHCPCCGKRVQGQHPEQTSQALGAANHVLGPRTVALAADLKYRLGIPFRKIADLFGGAFGLPCCAGGLTRSTARLATASRGLLEIFKLQLPRRFVVHADETSWWIGGRKAWLHVLATADLVVFQVGDRSRDIAWEILGPAFRGFVSCDGYVGYDAFATARCNAHPLRRIRDLLAAGASDATALETIQGLLQGGLTLRDRREALTELGFRRLVAKHKAQVHEWIVAHAAHADPAVGRLARHLGRYETEFLRYLDDPRIPATNNLGESTLRFAVLLRKIGCCNRTPRGVQTFEVLSSVLATFRRRGLDFTRWAIEFLQGSSPKYVPPDLLPASYEYQIVLRP